MMLGMLEDEMLVATYAVAAVLLVLYFACEHSACHATRHAETLYLCFMLLLMHVGFIVWGETGSHPAEVRSVYRLRQVMRVLMVLHVLFRFVFPRAHPPFFGVRNCARYPAQQWAPPATRRAKHKAEELEELIGDAIAGPSYGALLGITAGPALVPLLLVLLMLEDLMFAFTQVMAGLEVPLLLAVVALHVWGLSVGVSQVQHWLRRRALIDDLVADLLDRKADDVLRHVLATVSVGSLMEVASWTTVSKLIEEGLRQDMLCVVSKAALISGLQLKGVQGKDAVHSAIRDLILSCQGMDLTTLKNLIDGSGTYNNLYKLVYTDMTIASYRDEVLEHLATDAARVRLQEGRAVGVKILSDIDDTLRCSGGKFPAGVDRRYPRGTIYPGYLKLLQALDRQWNPKTPCCNLVFLSARPHLYKDVTEERSFKMFDDLVRDGRLHSFPTLLPGRLRPGLHAMATFTCLKKNSWWLVGKLKYTTYLNFRRLYQEYDFIFFGDNGQGDLLTAQCMLDEQRWRLDVQEDQSPKAGSTVEPGAVRLKACSPASRLSEVVNGGEASPCLLCVLIHQVQPPEHSLCLRLPAPFTEEERCIFYRTYVGAALSMRQHFPGLLNDEQLASIAESAVEEFEAARWSSERFGKRWQTPLDLLATDLERLQAELAVTLPRIASLDEAVKEAGWRRGVNQSGKAKPSKVQPAKHAKQTE